MPIWLVWNATDKRFLPEEGGLLDQQLELMNFLFEMDGLMFTMMEMLREERKDA